MQMTAHRPQEILAFLEIGKLVAREGALGGQFIGDVGGVKKLGDPEERVEIAQATLAVLDIGLLYDLTEALYKLNLNIGSAHVTTFGEKAIDVFYVTDLTGGKIENTARRMQIENALSGVLAPPVPAGAVLTGKAS